MMWTAHKIALFPAPVRFCGVTVLPVTVGQFRILEHLESPYTCGGLAMPSDLTAAVVICSLPGRVGEWCVRRVWPFKVLQGIASLKARLARVDWKAESVRFGRWMKECSWMPERFKEENEKAGFTPSCPYSYRVAYMLMDRFTERQILGMPMPKAHLYALARAESQGAQFETLDEYRANGLPEGYAYHPKDYPEIDKTLHPEEYQEKVTP